MFLLTKKERKALENKISKSNAYTTHGNMINKLVEKEIDIMDLKEKIKDLESEIRKAR